VVLASLLVLVLLLVGGLSALLGSEAGARFALRAATSFTAGALQVGDVAGTLRGPLVLRDLRYRDPDAGLDVALARVRIEWRPADLLRARLHIESLDLQQLRVRLSEPRTPPDDQPLALDPPIDLVIESLALRGALIERDGEPLLDVTQAAAAGSWTKAGLQLRRLDLVSPQGEVHLAGTVDEAQGVLTGQADGRFRWQLGDRRVAGRIEARSRNALADLTLELSDPFAATLGLELEQRDSLPWRFTLEVPTFDPRRGLLPGTNLRSLAARLAGRGDLAGGVASGRLRIDEQQFELDPLRVERRGEDLGIDVTLRNAAGRLRANGELWLGRETPGGRFELAWREVVLPAALAGQPLHTRGKARVEGSPERYTASAEFALGPPRRMADVELDAAGNAEGVDLQRLEVRQAAGQLSARGHLGFGDPLRWRVEATARDFDPGVFAAAWSGKLSFGLASRGSAGGLADASATLQINRLRGRLRGRAVAGDADLTLSPGPRLAGSAALRSGASRLRIDAVRGAQLDAALRADVPSLDDWLPGAAGSLSAKFTAAGQWPMLRVEGVARGRELRYADASGDALELRVDLVRPLEPRGSLRLEGRGLRAGGFDLRTLALRATGEPASHQVQLAFDGEPLSSELGLSGALADGGWRGEVATLVLDPTGDVRLVLQQPVTLAWADPVFDLSRACLADGEIRICVEGQGRADGRLQARYELAQLPLSLATAFAPSALPVELDGALDGTGRVERDADGRLQGEADLRSARGRVSLAAAEGDAAAQELLDYDDLRFDATFAGTELRARLVARLDDTGSLDARLTASDLGAARTPLDGLLRVDLPSLAVVGAFVPQLVNVDGRLALEASVGGTLDQPALAGELRVTELGADVPELGLELRAGRLRIVPADDGRFALDGSLRSGDGQLTFTGDVRAADQVSLRIDGRDFLAADRPGARVVIEPALTVQVADGRIDVDGRLTVPAATIDLQRLPRGSDRARSASPDVVVIDDEQRLEDDAAALPLYATVEVRLGEQVKLVGFGLDATVQGALQVNERPGAVTTGSGEIRVAGTYKAYGQDLTVRQGQLLYAGTPLDNPRLNIVAVRVVEDVTAGLRVTGRAQDPQLEVFSDPAMGQANALAYLVAGKPLESIGAGEAEGDALESAARSLGTAAGGLLAKNIGRRLGIDELGIKESAALGGDVLTIGQYLSPRLYLSYGVGLFTPGEVVTLRYKISDALAVEVENATNSSRAGVEYRYEK
jgi:translocation and assembly module TamB